MTGLSSHPGHRQVDRDGASGTPCDLVLAGGSIGELVMSRPGKPYRVRLSLDDGAVHGGAGGLREVGGLVTSAFLMLEVLPVLYTLWRQAQLRRAHARGVPIAAIVGRPPPRARDSL